MSFNAEAYVRNLGDDLKKKIEAGMEEGMEELVKIGKDYSQARIYSKPEPKNYKRTGLYKKSFRYNKKGFGKYELENTTPYGIYVEYKHGYLIMNDTVFNNLHKVSESILKSIK